MSTPWSWKEGNPHDITGDSSRKSWHRKLWGGELLFAQASQVTPGRGDIILSAVITPPHQLDHTHFRAALRNLRFVHPSIASKVIWPPPPAPQSVTEAVFVYEAPKDETEVHRWLDTVLHVHEKSSNDSVDSRLAALQMDVARADIPSRTDDVMHVHHVLPGPDDTDHLHGILLYQRHVLFDGTAAWQSLDCFIRQLAEVLTEESAAAALKKPVEWGTESIRLARPPSDRSLIPWTTADLHTNWPIIKAAEKNILRQSTSFGLPVPYPDAPCDRTNFLSASFTPEVTKMLTAACRTHGCKFFSLQLASLIIACRRLTTPPTEGEQRVVLPYNSVNVRPYMLPSTLTEGEPELIGALGYNTLSANDLVRFGEAKTGDVWTLARELQEQTTEQEPWQADVPRCAPMVMKALATVIFLNPPPAYPLRVFGITNFGVIDSMIKPTYAIPGGTGGHLHLTNAEMRGVMVHLPQSLLPILMHAYTWQGVLHYSFSYSPTHMGENGGKDEGERVGGATLHAFIEELKKLTLELAHDIAHDKI